MSTAAATISTRHVIVDSPIGPLTLVRDDDTASPACTTPATGPARTAIRSGRDVESSDDHGFDEAITQLSQYFAGERRDFDLPLNPRGSDTARQVWQRLAEIPYGQTTTYGELARTSRWRPRRSRHRRLCRRQPAVHLHRLPSSGRIHRETHRIRRRPGPQAIPARTGEGDTRLTSSAVVAATRSTDRMKPPFEKVVAQHGATVLRVVRAVLGHADADDAWSDTFLAAMKAYPDLPADANLEAWLVTIAHRKAIDIHRATSRRAIPIAGHTGYAVARSRRRRSR